MTLRINAGVVVCSPDRRVPCLQRQDFSVIGRRYKVFGHQAAFQNAVSRSRTSALTLEQVLQGKVLGA